MTADERLRAQYRCPKCHGTRCVVHHVTIPVNVLPLPMGRYLTTTCTLCGYTEFYDMAVFEALTENERAARTANHPITEH